MLYQMCHPGAKLNFMGNEFSQFIEWRYYEQLEWFLKDYDTHKKNSEFARELNHIFREEKSLYENNYDWSGFKWIDADNSGQSVLSFMRISGRQLCIVILNFGSCSYPSFKIGVPKNALYTELINSDSIEYGGEGFTNEGQITADLIPMHSQPFSIDIRLPSVGGTIIKYVKAAKSRKKAKSSEME